jgi:Co/Zn/Cd efflux system component
MANLAHDTHNHVFLGESHEKNERRTWSVIVLCTIMMVAEVVGGLLFGSIALVADGLHMSTHASALLLAALAYSYARRHAEDPRFSFGTGKLGDLAGFSSAIVLAMIAILICYEAVSRLFAPLPIHFNEAIPIAVLGLIVNVASALLLSGGGHGHHHVHGHEHGVDEHDHDAIRLIDTAGGILTLQIFEDGVPPRFRLAAEGPRALPQHATIETVRPSGARQLFLMTSHGGYLESVDEISEPHAFSALLRLGRDESYAVDFEEHDHPGAFVRTHSRHRRHSARYEPRPRHGGALQSRTTATGSATCICGGSAPAILAPSCRSPPPSRATPNTIGACLAVSAISRTLPSRCGSGKRISGWH